MRPRLSFGVQFMTARVPLREPLRAEPLLQTARRTGFTAPAAVPAGVGTAQTVPKQGLHAGRTHGALPLLTKAVEGPSGLASPGTGDARRVRSLGEGWSPGVAQL